MNNSSEKLAELTILTKADEWELLNDDNILFTHVKNGVRQLSQYTISSGKEKILLQNNGEMFTLNREKEKIYYNIRSQGNTDIMYFEH